jgi:hypothetical protein
MIIEKGARMPLLIPMNPEDARLRAQVCYLGRRVDA